MKEPKANKKNSDTKAQLLTAAANAFNADGFFRTDTNRIARLAGFAPQTFYRHFDDKLEAFLAVYTWWQASQGEGLARALAFKDEQMKVLLAAQVLVDHHLDWKGFRRSLRLLAVEEPRVRQARQSARLNQLKILANLPANKDRQFDDLASKLLIVERLCDALADGEVDDLGIDPDAWIKGIVEQVGLCLAPAKPAE